MVNQLLDFQKARLEFLDLVNKYPKYKREETLFDKWSLKDILVHLTGWGQHQIETLNYIKQGKVVPCTNGLKNSINIDLVAKKRKNTWDEVYNTFLKTTDKLETEYAGLTPELWKKKIWVGKNYTPESYIQIEIDHYLKTHSPQVRKVLKEHKVL